uniref:legumain n=1 Tax=Astyanax mexicanus TaxID=7994 RepID=A0A8B9H821_ASTMX
MAGTQSKQWVLLAAGSNTYENYRHQADVCHAYQMVHQHGIPDEQVVVMMYDDIAYNAENPTRGQIINEPNGQNVYSGVPKDYTGADVTAHNFLAVLRGDEEALIKHGCGSRKVLKSGKNDTIFVFLSDHGSKGIFSFPHDTLYASDLIATVTKMAESQQFSKMVIYIESCFSGSMIEHLPPNIQVYGVSASGLHQTSTACFYDDYRHTFLAHVFSSYWLLHCRMSDLTRTTFQDQFKYLMKKVKKSTPCQYGNKNLSKLYISDFLGCANSETRSAHDCKAKTFEPTHLTASHDVPLVLLNKKIERETDPIRKRDLLSEQDNLLQKKARIEKAVNDIAKHVNPKNTNARSVHCPLTHLGEMKEIAEHFRLTFSDSSHKEDVALLLSHMHIFDDLLKAGAGVERIKAATTLVHSLD